MPQPTCRSDEDIQVNVSEELRETSSKRRALGVAVNGGVVVLSGEVGSLPERHAARQTALRVPGVTAVADNLQVHASDTTAATDADIAQTAIRLLDRVADAPFDTVTVEVRHGVITLSGSVMRDYQRVAAARAVRYINGVIGFTNNIAVRA